MEYPRGIFGIFLNHANEIINLFSFFIYKVYIFLFIFINFFVLFSLKMFFSIWGKRRGHIGGKFKFLFSPCFVVGRQQRFLNDNSENFASLTTPIVTELVPLLTSCDTVVAIALAPSRLSSRVLAGKDTPPPPRRALSALVRSTLKDDGGEMTGRKCRKLSNSLRFE